MDRRLVLVQAIALPLLLGAAGCRCGAEHDPHKTIAPLPSETVTPTPPVVKPPVARLSAGETDTCQITKERRAKCWGGRPLIIGEPTLLPWLSEVRQVVLGEDHVCSLVGEGRVQCSGLNDKGQLGDGTRERRNEGVTVGLPAPASQLAARGKNTCAVLENGQALCWGSNEFGQLGDGTKVDRERPTRVPLPGPAVEIGVGSFGHACARLRDGAVWCWGSNRFGQLGVGSTSDSPSPQHVAGVTSSRLVVGFAHACSIDVGESAVWCWGWNDHGILADGTTTDRTTPVRTKGVAKVNRLAAGEYHTCATNGGPGLWCWGRNTDGEIGDGSKSLHLEAIEVKEPRAVAEMALGSMHSCVLLDNDDVQCWGRPPPK